MFPGAARVVDIDVLWWQAEIIAPLSGTCGAQLCPHYTEFGSDQYSLTTEVLLNFYFPSLHILLYLIEAIANFDKMPTKQLDET